MTDQQQKRNQALKTRLKANREDKNRDETCELHQSQLVSGKVNLRFGLPSLSDEYMKARMTLFPNSKLILYGGCSPPVINEETNQLDMETFVEVKYCKQCREIEEQWLKINKSDT